MNNRSKILIIIIGGFILIALCVFLFVYNTVNGLDTSTNKEDKIVFPILKDSLYVIASAWGLTGDHIEIVVSHSLVGNRRSNIDSDYIFYEPIIYYKQEFDTLVIYSLTFSNIPGNFKSRIKVKQVKVKNIEEMKRYELTHGILGLTKISIYN